MHHPHPALHRPSRIALTLAALTTAPHLSHAAIPAFSGADGAGALTTGGRGGVVYHVTRLDSSYSDNGPGTLRYGLADSNFKDPSGNVVPRTIVFDVGGTIWLGRFPNDTAGWDTQDAITVGSNVTIAGQTAPGGINILGGTLKVNCNNSIIRNLFLAPGYGTRNTESDGIPDAYVYDAINVHASGVIIDHVSAVFATDETVSADEFANNVTLQYSNVSQGQNYPNWDTDVTPNRYTGHALGSLWAPGTNAKSSIHHNLYAHQKSRVPRVGTSISKLQQINGVYVGAINEFRNNVFYNWAGTAGSGGSNQPSTNNFISNFYRAGPGGEDGSGSTKGSPQITTIAGGTGIFSGSNGPTGVYHSGNFKDTNKNATADFSTALTNSDFGSSVFSASPYALPNTGPAESAQLAYNRVLDYMGANWQSRNPIDARIVSEVRTGTGQITAWNDATHGTEWNYLLSLRGSASGGIGGSGVYARPANFDTDRDGMPDTWELAHALNPNSPDNNGDFDANGYTNLEHYLNDLAAFPAPAALVFNNASATGRYAEIGNWTTGTWQPSRFDEAQINSGAATIDSPGQHAATLKIAATPSSTATLNITSGWLDLAHSLSVGPASGATGHVTQAGGVLHAASSVTLTAGSYTLAGGTLATPLLSASPNATFNFTGGTLHADTIALNLTVQGGTLAPGSDFFLRLLAANSLPDINYAVPPISPDVGHTLVTGSLTLTPAATLELDLDSPTSHDALTITGPTTLAGTLALSHPATPTIPPYLTRFTILTTSSLAGTFSTLTGLQLDPLHTYVPLYTPTTVDLLLTLPGDANLNGAIDPDDYALLDRSFALQPASPQWTEGDFNHDRIINHQDYLILDRTHLLTQPQTLTPTFLSQRESQFGPAYVQTLLTSLPEPSLALTLLLPLLKRRRPHP